MGWGWPRSRQIGGPSKKFFPLFQKFSKFFQLCVFASTLSFKVVKLLLCPLVIEFSLLAQFFKFNFLVNLEILKFGLHELVLMSNVGHFMLKFANSSL